MNTYQKYIKENPEKMQTECDRIKKYLNDKYKNDEEYKLKRITYQRDYRARKKAEKIQS